MPFGLGIIAVFFVVFSVNRLINKESDDGMRISKRTLVERISLSRIHESIIVEAGFFRNRLAD
ncbi:hypothetical protein F6Y03_00070 [Bacillus megaterium]|nr:hypothetical protein [Priestia megaterium]